MDTVFDGHLFAFYKWDGDVKDILPGGTPPPLPRVGRGWCAGVP